MDAPAPVVPEYGLFWPTGTPALEAVMFCIRRGGEWTSNGRKKGAPLFDLYRRMESLVWPDQAHTDWSDLILRHILSERITAVLGPKDSGKTNRMARFALCDYFCFPQDTLILMSSTDLRGLELRVWGEVKALFNKARDRFPLLPGYAVDSLKGIFTDDVGDADEARDIRKGLICVPVVDSSGAWRGLAKWVGIKQRRRRLLSDEMQFAPDPFLSTLANLDSGDFKGVFSGNPRGEGDPLDRISEPVEGWDNHPETGATTTWRNRMGGVTIQLYGPDSPNIRHPDRYPYLISQASIDRVVAFYGRDSLEYHMQAVGVRRGGLNARRILTRDMTRQFGATDAVVWRGSPTAKGYALDASYGGDRCVGGPFEFGEDINGTQVIAFGKPRVIPIRAYGRFTPESDRLLPEDQIAAAVHDDCEAAGIDPSRVYFDSTGRGSLGTAFARLWSAQVNPVEFGGSATTRPVCGDLFIEELDEFGRKRRRLKRCDEHYRKFVTELWFSVRYAVESRQVRNLPEEAIAELCAREWGIVRGNLIEVEPKEDTKPRLGRSPDFGDWAALCVEGARRLGFQIARLAAPKPPRTFSGLDPWARLREKAARIHRASLLDYSA